ncbi:hypothetical protein FH972_026907 [Carpinus fangiana]|uniref:Uncharacterized protein n=1 Tax=Carpinus fangiana TaxID=176857 RepID=A0A5N6L5F4_9ROSI|nr:hypothetical protein FH972_026907 [Carpinus fangiana]
MMAQVGLVRSSGRKDLLLRLQQCALCSAPFVGALFLGSVAWHWILSGTPLLTVSLIIAGRDRIFQFVPLWTLVLLLNLAYAIASTSWLFSWLFAAISYPTLFISCISQFAIVSRVLKHILRALLKNLHFTSDKIAFFNIPALEIDRDVDGLMVVRGITLSFSTLTVFAHGVEVGIKLSDDMELALVVDLVTIKLFRGINIGDVYANIKGSNPQGGEHEMSFHQIAPNTKDVAGNAMMDINIFNKDSRMLNAARDSFDEPQQRMVKMTQEMTGDSAPESLGLPEDALKSVKPVSAGDKDAARKYSTVLRDIRNSSVIYQSIQAVEARVSSKTSSNSGGKHHREMRAAICAELHHRRTIAHPPSHSIKVTTLQNLAPPAIRGFLHRLPLLLRLLLNNICHFHPIIISSITAGGSGSWIETTINKKIFSEYAVDNADIANLQERISDWLKEANFCVQLVDTHAVAQVPVNATFDIKTSLKFDDVLVYRASSSPLILKEVIRLGGVDATVTVPSCLLPHHEHLLPPQPTTCDMMNKLHNAEEAPGLPKAVQADKDLQQVQKDETNAIISSHVRLPVCFDQELLDFIAVLVKATKIVEIERDSDEVPQQSMHGMHGLRDFTKETKEKMKHGLHKVTFDALANDRWIAKLVGKITKKLETACGDIGYTASDSTTSQLSEDLWLDHPEMNATTGHCCYNDISFTLLVETKSVKSVDRYLVYVRSFLGHGRAHSHQSGDYWRGSRNWFVASTLGMCSAIGEQPVDDQTTYGEKEY